MSDKKILPRWIRLTEEGQERLHQEYLKAGDSKASDEWVWFCNVVDYREGCNRTSHLQTWRTRLVRILLWVADKATE